MLEPAQPQALPTLPEVRMQWKPRHRFPESIAALAVLRPAAAAMSRVQPTDSWETERVTPSTELTTRAFCPFSEPDLSGLFQSDGFVCLSKTSHVLKKNG